MNFLRAQTGLRAGGYPPTNQDDFNLRFNQKNQACLSYTYDPGEQILDVDCALSALLSTVDDCVTHGGRENTCYGFASFYHDRILEYPRKISSRGVITGRLNGC